MTAAVTSGAMSRLYIGVCLVHNSRGQLSKHTLEWWYHRVCGCGLVESLQMRALESIVSTEECSSSRSLCF